MSNYKYEEGEVVTFNNGIITGFGKIRGIANIGVAVLGVSYILEIVHSVPVIDVKIYPYSCIVISELFLTKAD